MLQQIGIRNAFSKHRDIYRPFSSFVQRSHRRRRRRLRRLRRLLIIMHVIIITLVGWLLGRKVALGPLSTPSLRGFQ
jgi:hypothetical protein